MTLGFGDRRYDEADLVPQILGHPHAPVQFALGNMLRAAYLHAQQHGRVILQQTYGFNARNFSADLNIQRAFTASGAATWVGVTRGFVELPRETSHLVVDVAGVIFNFAPTSLAHRLTVSDGTDCDTTESTLEFEADNRPSLIVSNGQLSASPNDFARAFGAEFPFANVFAVRTHSFALALSNVDVAAAGVVQVRLEARALRTTDGETYAVPVAYRPLFAQVTAAMEWSP